MSGVWAKEALTAIKRFEFEIITTSIELSDMDGYKLIEQVRKSVKQKDIEGLGLGC